MLVKDQRSSLCGKSTLFGFFDSLEKCRMEDEKDCSEVVCKLALNSDAVLLADLDE